MLQTPFLNGNAPLHWAICNLPSTILAEEILPAMPPVISALINATGTLSAQTLEAIEAACSIIDSNPLFQCLCPLTKGADGEMVYMIAKRNDAERTYDFCINEFPTHMLMEGRVDMKIIFKGELGSRCVAICTLMKRLIDSFVGCLYSLGFSAKDDGRWFFFWKLAHGTHPVGRYLGRVDLFLRHNQGDLEDFLLPLYLDREGQSSKEYKGRVKCLENRCVGHCP
jgi:hypothetical protein